MNKYQQAKIYKLFNTVDDSEYYGSSIKKYLSNRMGNHRTKARDGCTYPLYQKMREIGIGNWYIELVELWPCGSVEELRAREAYHIRLNNPVLNVNIPGRKWAQYYLDNQDSIREYKSQSNTCCCGIQYTNSNKSNHLKSKRHQLYLQFGGLNQISI